MEKLSVWSSDTLLYLVFSIKLDCSMISVMSEFGWYKIAVKDIFIVLAYFK